LIRGIPDPLLLDQKRFTKLLTDILTHIQTHETDLNEITKQIIRLIRHRRMKYQGWEHRTRFHLLVSGLARVDEDGFLHITDKGVLFLKTKTMRIILNSLKENVLGISEIESMLRERPKTMKEIQRELRRKWIDWKNLGQIRNRINHLRLLGAVDRINGKYRWMELTYTHDEVQMILNELGRLLGYHSRLNYRIDGDNRIDVAWFRDDTNNSPLKYAFEVHLGGSIDSAKTNLETALSRWDNARAILVVLNDEEVNKAEKTIELIPPFIRKRITIIKEPEKLDNLLQQVKKLNHTLEELGFKYNFLYP